MFILRFINDDDDLSVKEFVSLADLKVSKIKDLIKKAKVITIASSPFFIEQDYAIKVLKELFNYDII